MELTGELKDLSLAELIEFFCNQRKTGTLKVTYTIGPGYFYLESGSVVHARIGALCGLEAVYYALTLPNASFTFSTELAAGEHTINQSWTAVVLEGLRRLDEGIEPGDPFSAGQPAESEEAKLVEQGIAAVTDAVAEQIESPEAEPDEQPVIVAAVELPQMAAFLSQTESATRSGSWKPGAVVVAVALIVGVVAVPWGMYARRKTAQLASEAQTRPATTSEPAALPAETNQTPNEPVASESAVASPAAAADLAARRWREGRARERARALETSSVLAPPQSTTAAVNPRAQATPVSGSRKVTVQVTYDENGRVTQASGGDATALRIARQKRFPAGKAGAATITIPIN